MGAERPWQGDIILHSGRVDARGGVLAGDDGEGCGIGPSEDVAPVPERACRRDPDCLEHYMMAVRPPVASEDECRVDGAASGAN
jgi:hypothetical protein